MNTSKKLLTSLLVGLLGLSLFGLASAQVGQATIHDREVVKGWFYESNFYEQIVDVVLEQAKQSEVDNKSIQSVAGGLADLPIDNPDIQLIAKEAFNGKFLQESVEKVLDGTYSWLDGSSEQLNFTVDLTGPKLQFATGVGSYVTDRLATLPVCAGAQATPDYDAFTANCRPGYITATQAGDEYKTRLLSDNFLKNPVLTADNLVVKKADGTSVALAEHPNAASLKSAYQQSAQLPLILGIIAVLLSTGILLIDPLRWRSLRRVGYVFNVTGVIFLTTFLVLSYLFSNNKDKLTLSGSGSPEQTKLLLDFGAAVIGDITYVLSRFAIGYLVIGVLCFIISFILKKRQAAPVTTPEPAVGPAVPPAAIQSEASATPEAVESIPEKTE